MACVSEPTRPATDDGLIAPHGDEQMVVRPALTEIGPMAEANAAVLEGNTYDCQGRTLGRLRPLARREAHAAASAWSAAESGSSPAPPAQEPPSFLILGHQPDLFHPGVWVKNFAVAALAQSTGRAPLNLIVDNDVIKNTALRVPAGSPGAPHVETVPFDRWVGPRPYEDGHVTDMALFESFAARVSAVLEPFGFKPLLEDLWPVALRHARQGAPLGECFARARSRLEHAWGFGTRELPISRMAALESFRWFTSHLLAQLPRFQTVHNTELADYRRRNHIRSPGRPVPELVQDDGWLEAPFWIWQRGETHRHRLFAAHQAKQIVLRSGGREVGRLPLHAAGEACCAVEELGRLEARGIKLRPRALTTTLFARLVLGDTFFHGIGGAKYDELTDQIIGRFFGFAPPGFVALSATLHLPFAAAFPDAAARAQRLAQLLRDLQWNPDRHLAQQPLDPDLHRWVDAKHAAQIIIPRTPEARYMRFHQIRLANQALQRAVEPLRSHALRDLQRARAQAQAHRILVSREYSFCLFPAEKLRAYYWNAGFNRAGS